MKAAMCWGAVRFCRGSGGSRAARVRPDSAEVSGRRWGWPGSAEVSGQRGAGFDRGSRAAREAVCAFADGLGLFGGNPL